MTELTNNTRAIVALLEIMSNEDALLRRRIEAAEAVLGYEAPKEIVERTKVFLTAVFEDSEHVCVEDRLEALRLMRKAEAPRIAQQTIRAANSDKDRELWRDLEIAARRMKLYKAGLWGQVTPDWADDLLRDDYIPPPPGTNISDLFDD